MNDEGRVVFGLVALARRRAWLLALALIMAGCAGAPSGKQAEASSSGSGFSQSGGVNIAYAEFQNSAFPYHGSIPEEGRPFLNVNENGRLGHSSPRGGVYWEDETYNDRHVLIAAGADFDARRGGDLILYFHGNQATLARDVVDRQQTPQQVAQSGSNSVLIAPQMAVNAFDSSAGRFWQPGQLAAFLNEADQRLATLYGGSSGEFRRLPVVIVAAICPLPIRSRSAARTIACAASCCSMRFMAKKTNSPNGSSVRAGAPFSSAPIRSPRASKTRRLKPG
jgi:hypothetical protein